jgi:hypothetical protein
MVKPTEVLAGDEKRLEAVYYMRPRDEEPDV